MSDRLERYRQFQMSAAECVICLGVLSQPKFLSCLHTFCLSCLDQLHHASNNDELICPTCRASTVVPSDGVKGLRTNFIVDQMIEFRKLCDVTCNACADCSTSSSSAVALATAYCVDCGDNLCENCVSAHRKIRTLKSHRLVEVGANDAAGKLRELSCGRPVYCADHPHQEIALYCTDCSTSICLTCCVLAHRTHGYVDIKERANETRKELANVIDVVSEKLSDFRKANDELELKLLTTSESSTQTLNEIRRRTDEIIADVRFQENGLIESVQKYQHQFEKQMEAMLEDVQTKIAGIENFILLCQQLRDSETHSDVVRLSSQVSVTADELRAANFCRASLPSLVFTPANGSLSEFNVLGEVAVIEVEGECRTDLAEEQLRNCGTWNVEDDYNRDRSSTECGNTDFDLNRSLRRDNDDPATDLPSTSTAVSDSVARFIPSNVSEKTRASRLRENSIVKNHADCMRSKSSTISIASQETVSDGYPSNVEVHRSFEKQASYCSSSGSSNNTSVDISDMSSEDQSEDDDYTDNSGHLQNGKRSGNLERPVNEHNTNRHRSFDTLGSSNATPPHIPLFPITGGYFEEPQRRRRGSADIETIPGVDPVVGLALLDCFLFVLHRNSDALEVYDQNSLSFVRREPIKDLSQPTDLTACPSTHTLYIGHTRKVIFSVKLAQSTLSTKKLSVAFHYAHLSTTYNSSVLMGCPKAEAILEYTEDPHWKLIRCIQMPGTYPTGMVQLSSNRFAVSSRMNVVYIITEEGPNSTCEEVPVPHNMSHVAIDISGTDLLVADCYGHQIRRLDPNCQGKARSSLIVETKTISRPCRLWTDTVGRRLFVGTTHGDVKVLHLD